MSGAKPCPFCGAADIDLQTGVCDSGGYPVNVACVECGAAGPWTYVSATVSEAGQRALALTEWNRRKG